MHRFFVTPEALRSDRVTLTGPQARQIATVLRLRTGEEITLVADGAEAVVALETVRPTSVTAVVRERGFTPAEPSVALTLALPVLRGDHDEEVVEAVAQLGVSRIVPFTSSRSVVRSLSDAKRARWERIAREAAETARRVNEAFRQCDGRTANRSRRDMGHVHRYQVHPPSFQR